MDTYFCKSKQIDFFFTVYCKWFSMQALMQLYRKCMLLTFESYYTHVLPHFSSCIKSSRCPVAQHRVQSSLKVPSRCFKRRDGGEATSSRWPLLLLSAAPQKKAGEMPAVFLFFHFDRLGWHPNKRAVVQCGLTMLCKCMTAAAAA